MTKLIAAIVLGLMITAITASVFINYSGLHNNTEASQTNKTNLDKFETNLGVIQADLDDTKNNLNDTLTDLDTTLTYLDSLLTNLDTLVNPDP